MIDLKISVTCQCRACHGEGYTRDARWDDFYHFARDWEQDHPAPHPDTLEYECWALHQLDAETQWWAHHDYPGGPKHWPAEEPQCSTCQGSGRESLQLPLAELAQHLGIEAGWPA